VTTYVQIEDPTDLIGRAQAEMDGKRLQRQEVAEIEDAVIAATTTKAVIPDESQRQARREELAAPRLLELVRHNRLHLERIGAASGLYEYLGTRVYSLNGQTSITFANRDRTIADPPPPGPGQGLLDGTAGMSSYQRVARRCHLVLPIDDQSAVIAIMDADRLGTAFIRGTADPAPNNLLIDFGVGETRIQGKAFYVNQTTVRELTLPSAVAAVMQPSPVGASNLTVTYQDYLTTEAYFRRFPLAQFDFPVFSVYQRFCRCRFGDVSEIALNATDYGQTGGGLGSLMFLDGTQWATPAVYRMLQNFQAAESLTYSGQFNSALYNFVGRTVVPQFSYSPASAALDHTLAYIGPRLFEDDEEPRYRPSDDYPNDWRPHSVQVNLGVHPYGPEPTLENVVFWERVTPVYFTPWSSAGYNRAKLTQLGFSSQDLMP
jgi:hypothetical protein